MWLRPNYAVGHPVHHKAIDYWVEARPAAEFCFTFLNG